MAGDIDRLDGLEDEERNAVMEQKKLEGETDQYKAKQ